MTERKMNFKDRKDGYFVKVDSFHSYFNHLNPHRTDCEVCLQSQLDVAEALKYLEKKKAETGQKITFFHLVVTAVSKMVYLRPKMNYFVAGRRTYERKNVVMSFVAKKQFSDSAEEALMMLDVKPDYNLEKISQKIVGDVKEARKDAENGEQYGADAALDMCAKLPRWLMMFVMWVFRKLDWLGLFPESFTSVDPNYSTILLSNLGSIKCHSVYHHLSDFGTNSIILTIGTIHKEMVYDAEGNGRMADICDFAVTIDERIGDGFYFARCFKLVQHILNHPELLDDPVNTLVEYEG